MGSARLADHHPGRFVSRRIGVSTRQRVAAVAALVADAVGLALLVVLVLMRPLHALAVVLWGVLFVTAGFVLLTSTGVRRRVATVAVVVTGVVLVASIFLWSPSPREPGWQGPMVVVLLVLGALLQRVALQVPTPGTADLFTYRGPRSSTHGVLLLNPRSGGGKAEQFELADLARRLGIETVLLEPGADLRELAEDAVARGADALGMGGGDGSLGVVAGVAAAHDLPFVCVPAGTRNHFALDIGLDRADPRGALGAFVQGEHRHVDYATVNERIFLNNVSAGLYAAIIDRDSYRDAKVETALALLPELWEQGGPWFDLHFDVPGHDRLEQAAVLQVSNNPYGREVGRRDRLDGGVLGMITADPRRLGDLVGLTLLAAAGQADRASALWTWEAPSFRVESDQPALTVGLDGEAVPLTPPLRFASVHRGLRLLVPEGTRVGLDEQQRGVGGTYAALFQVAFGLEDRDD